ncbi:MAG: B-box zinc finger protein [Pseudomonadota bacterium]
MPTPCTSHPTQPAQWQCHRCQVMLCPQCIDRREKGYQFPNQFVHYCPKCNVEVRWLGAGNIIDPFWKRLPKFFSFPLHPRPLVLMAVFCTIAVISARDPGFFSLILMGGSYCVMLLYSFAALRGTAQGDLSPPPLSQATLSDGIGLVVKQIGIYVLIGFAFFISAAKLGIFIGGVVLVVALLGLPAMVILLVTTGSLIQAVNPMMFLPLATRIGWGYLLMYLFLILLGGAPQALAGRIAAVVPPMAMPVLSTAAKFYYMLISYHLMGYVLMQYHTEIGYTIDQENFRESDASAALPALVSGDAKTLQDVALLLRSGAVEDAIACIQARGASDAMQSLVLSGLYMKMLKLKKMGEPLVHHLPIHLKLLVAGNKKSDAIALYLSPLAQHTEGSLPADIRFKIAGWLSETGKSPEALAAFQSIIDDDADMALAAKAHLRMAQIYNDRMMQPEKARDILNDALDRFPNSAVADQMHAYRSHL